MAVTWPDGSVTGSVRVPDVEPAPIPVAPEPETPTTDPDPYDKKEVKDGAHR